MALGTVCLGCNDTGAVSRLRLTRALRPNRLDDLQHGSPCSERLPVLQGHGRALHHVCQGLPFATTADAPHAAKLEVLGQHSGSHPSDTKSLDFEISPMAVKNMHD